MAHNLEIRDGRASMMYVGDPPWHKLGTQLGAPATAEQAIKAANMDWQVMKVPVYAAEGRRKLLLEGKYAIVRQDLWSKRRTDCPWFGIVAAGYTPLQNREAFSFFDPIVGKGAAVYHTAGVLGRGERIWILAKLPASIRVIGDDIADKYLLLSNSHDGESAVQVKFTPIRVVCQNTLTMALSQGTTLRVEHTADMHERLSHGNELLGIVNTRYSEIERHFQRMARVQVNTDRLSEYLRLVFPDPRDPDNKRAAAWVVKNRSAAARLFQEGCGNREQQVRGTLWAAYNGVTELVDHPANRPPNERHLASIWFGEGYYTKARAFTAATDCMKAWSN